MSAAKRWAVLGFVIVAAVVAFAVLRPGDESSSTKSNSSPPGPSAPKPAGPAPPPPTTIAVVGGRPAGGVERITVTRGQRVRFTVRSDVADEVHVHGYDLTKRVPAGGSVTFDFAARDDGGFEVELEHRSALIATLRVQP